MVKGKVKFFDDRKGYGRIQIDGSDTLVKVVKASIQGLFQSLFEGEEVEFRLDSSIEDRPQARDVQRLITRVLGVVSEYANGYGWISYDDEGRGQDIFFHHSDIIGSGFKRADTGDAAEFTPSCDARGRKKAILVKVDSRSAFEKYAYTEDIDDLLRIIAAKAEPEKWESESMQSSRRLPILWNYLKYTFKRLKEEGKICEFVDERERQLSCFNIGLITELGEEIFILLRRPEHELEEGQKWITEGVFCESDRQLSRLRPLPALATYFTEPKDLMFDCRANITVDLAHIINERLDRFPGVLRANEYQLSVILEGAIKAAKRKVERSYRTAIPQFHDGKIELLLPLCLQEKKKVDLALVVVREAEEYRATTVLPVEVAYSNARLIARPDSDWLVA